MCASSSDNAPTPSSSRQLPVIIAGAGPAGLVAALTLQREKIPFIVYEKAKSSRLCGNAGSGIDMAPTALRILDEELGLAGRNDYVQPYEYIHISNMKGKTIKAINLLDLGERFKKMTDGGRFFGFASRSTLQVALLDTLGFLDEKGQVREDLPSLRCFTTVTGYRQHNTNKGTEESAPSKSCVTVQLSDGTTVEGMALLACDGIHSAVRKCMHDGKDDPLHYCGQECWWGKSPVEKNSELERELEKVAKENGMKGRNVSIFVMGSRKCPGGFFSCEVTAGEHAWAYMVPNKKRSGSGPERVERSDEERRVHPHRGGEEGCDGQDYAFFLRSAEQQPCRRVAHGGNARREDHPFCLL